jgi:hypothetical protein
MAAGAPREVERWALMSDPDGGMMIILVVDDSDDDELTAAVAREKMVPADNFGGVCGAPASATGTGSSPSCSSS